LYIRTCPPVLSQVRTDFSENLKKYQLNFFLITSKGIKTYGHRLSGVFSGVFRKVRKTRHQYPEFGPKPGEIKKKNLQKSTLAFKGVVGSNSEMRTTFCAKLSFHPVLTPSFVFHGRLHCCYIYFHCSYLYNYYNYLEPCALNGESQNFIPRFNNKKLPYFADLRQRGDRGVKRGPKTGWRQDDFKENSSVSLGLGFRLGGASLFNGSFSGIFHQEALGSPTKGGNFNLFN